MMAESKNVCAYCDYPLDDPHEGGLTGEDQCPVCGANESRQLSVSAWLKGTRGDMLVALADETMLPSLLPMAIRELTRSHRPRLVNAGGQLTSLGRATAKHLTPQRVPTS